MYSEKKYLAIVERLGLDVKADEEAGNVLDSPLKDAGWEVLEGKIMGMKALIFGCGPSLIEDVLRFKECGRVEDAVVIAVDGAAKALLENNVIPDVVVTDLDGDRESLLKASRYGSLTVVHGHGDNINALRSIVPKLSGLVYGTTQVKPSKRVRNFGGFTDGDRAAYLAERFNPKAVFLAGMDFGKVVGFYSGIYDKRKKIVKLAIGKELLEDLVSKSKIKFFNLTSGGEEIKGAERTSWTALRSFKS